MQVCPEEQTRPHEPQLLLSSEKFTQTDPQRESPNEPHDVVEVVHTPDEQVCPEEQTRPHEPQLLKSPCRLVQVDPQRL